MRFFAAAATVAALCSPALAFINPGKVDLDYSPAVISPTTGNVWTAGQKYNVSWNTVFPSGINQSEVSQTANLVLGFNENGSENLNYLLAEDVPLYTTGSYEVTLPSDLIYKETYIVALIGSSGDISKEFTINPADPASLIGLNLNAVIGKASRRNMKRRN